MGRKNVRYPEEFRNQIVKEVEEVGNATLVARKHDLIPGTVTRWVRESKQASKTNNPLNIDYSTNSPLDKENEQLKKLLGEKDLEIAILKDLLKKTNLR
jgi:transposase